MGYVVLTDGEGLDFGQCMCCWTDDQQEIGNTIKANRGSLKKLILCGICSDYNTQLGIEATFDDLGAAEKDTIKAHITNLKEEIDAVFDNYRKQESNMRKQESNIRNVRRLLDELRYEDARQHCQVCGLDYDQFLKEACEKHATK